MNAWIVGQVHAPKRGCDRSTYEDAFLWAPGRADHRTFRLAISDGATESAFAGLWAKMLVEAFVKDTSWERQLETLAKEWAEQVWSRDLPWNLQEKASLGAHASLLGAVITLSRSITRVPGSWVVTAQIFGDSCMFVLDQDGVLKRSYPYTQPVEFDTRPYLLSTLPEHRQRALDHGETRRTRLTPSQQLLVSTDAIGRWMLEASPADIAELSAIALASDQTAFERWLERGRAEGSLRDDDCTVVVVTRG